ncbi:hypothetical protein ACWF9G_26505 [Nocardia sp. NPDC055029]
MGASERLDNSCGGAGGMFASAVATAADAGVADESAGHRQSPGRGRAVELGPQVPEHNRRSPRAPRMLGPARFGAAATAPNPYRSTG